MLDAACDPTELLPPFSFRDEDEVERLATMEHERWMRAEDAARAASGNT